MLVCRIRTFRILRRLEIIKYVQHTLAGARHVHQWTHKELPNLFVLVTCGTEPFVAFLRIVGDQSDTRTTSLTKLTLTLPFTYRFPFVVLEACLTPKLSFAHLTRNSIPPVFTRNSYHTVTTCLLASVFHAISKPLLQTSQTSFSHSACQIFMT